MIQINCPIGKVHVNSLKQMVSRPGFSGIEMVVNDDRGTYLPFQAEQVREEQVLVTFKMSENDVDSFEFFREMRNVLDSERGRTANERVA